MPLVKTSKLSTRSQIPKSVSEPNVEALAAPKTNGKKPTLPQASRQAKVSERLAASTEELAAGLAEASSAAEELRRSMEQIAAGSDEAAGAAQEQLGAIKSVVGNLSISRVQSEGSLRRTDALQSALADTAAQISRSVNAIERNAARATASLELIKELEDRAKNIGEITLTVSRISDQTNLLALNAAIEAARAGDHGRGFAVVADEVRSLAETSEKSAQDVQRLANAIQADVLGIVTTISIGAETALSEAKSGTMVVETLDAMRQDIARLKEGAEATAASALEAERAAIEAQRGVEQVASAAEEQSAGAAEAQSAIRQQAQALDQGQVAAQALANVSGDIRSGKAAAASAEQVAAAAEELSATIQELSSAATQIMAAVEQINRGSQQQAAATQETSAAFSQIESTANIALKNAGIADDRVKAMEVAVKESRDALERLIDGVDQALQGSRTSLASIVNLEAIGRKMEKFVGSIGLVTVQTTMLAVSGSVEAARAGDAGRGFAVVSNDIRALAREASESVERAKDTVGGILDQINSLRHDLEQIIATAETEAQNNRAIYAAFATMEENLKGLATANGAILDGANGILSAAAQMAGGAQQVAAAADEAGAASRQASIAASQQAQGAEDLAAAIEEIASLADELKHQDG